MKAVLGSVVTVAAITVLVSGTAAQQPAPAPAPAAAPAPAPATITTKIGYIDVQRVLARSAAGVAACATLLKLQEAGRGDAKLYPGSWSEWCRRGLPGERG